MTTTMDAITALRAQAQAIADNTIKPKKPVLPPQKKAKPESDLTVHFIFKDDLLEVHFNQYPGPAIIEDIKSAGFRWDSDDKFWWARDNQNHRDFCNTYFDPDPKIEPINTPAQPAQPVIQPVQKIEVAPPKPAMFCRTPGDWNTYCQQVDELLTHFREVQPDYCAGDLQIAAIDAYHKAVFSEN